MIIDVQLKAVIDNNPYYLLSVDFKSKKGKLKTCKICFDKLLAVEDFAKGLIKLAKDMCFENEK